MSSSDIYAAGKAIVSANAVGVIFAAQLASGQGLDSPMAAEEPDLSMGGSGPTESVSADGFLSSADMLDSATSEMHEEQAVASGDTEGMQDPEGAAMASEFPTPQSPTDQALFDADMPASAESLLSEAPNSTAV